MTGETPQRPGMEGADERALEKREAPKRVRDVGGGRSVLEVDVDPDRRSLVVEELKRVVECRQVGRDLPESGEGLVPDRSSGGAVADLSQVVGVRDDQVPGVEPEDVELDEIHARFERGAKPAEGVLGSKRRSTAVPDAERPAFSSLERQHGSRYGLVGR